MQAINNLLDKAAATCSPNNDRALAKRMHVTPSAVSLWRKGGAIKEKHLTALIVLADVDEVQALQVLAEQAETKPEKAVWSALLQRVGATAAIVLCAIGFSMATPQNAHAINDLPALSRSSVPANAYYVKPDFGWWWKLLRDWLAWRLRGSKSDTGSLDACHTA